MEKIIVYTDGGSRGNPGEAAVGVVIKNHKDEMLKSYGEAIGIATNNVAEYSAVVFALQKLKQLFGKEKTAKLAVEFRMDSQLAVKQLGGEYRIENEALQNLFMKIWNLKFDFGSLHFVHIPREQNHEADAMANEALDKKSDKKSQKLF
ncbi:MAG: ribonuclease HI family protein [Patescibacteria group bacterium]